MVGCLLAGVTVIDTHTTFTVLRNGYTVSLPVVLLQREDLVLSRAGSWQPAHTHAGLAPFFPPPPPSPVVPSPGRELVLAFAKGFFGALLAIGGAVATYKVGQAIFDEDFGTVEFPLWFRRQKIKAHVAIHGWYCPKCKRSVRRGSLTVDHIVALQNGGHTSRLNAQVICGPCNSSKGARNVPLDFLRGRSS
jgi:hypothetical protein